MPITIQAPFTPNSYKKILNSFDGKAQTVFVRLTQSITTRFFEQLELTPPSPAFIEKLLTNIWVLLKDEELPKPLPKNEIGTPQEPNFNVLNELCDRCLAIVPKHRTEDHLRELIMQLFIALLSPEFRSCRLSYQDVDNDQKCIRQHRSHCVDRISGSHCEDCPYFVALSANQHTKLFKRSWQSDDSFERNKELFLPEDFRALRIFWHLHLRID